MYFPFKMGRIGSLQQVINKVYLQWFVCIIDVWMYVLIRNENLFGYEAGSIKNCNLKFSVQFSGFWDAVTISKYPKFLAHNVCLLLLTVAELLHIHG